ncbi:hypothetical protein BV25DRAFT_1918057 [Artomyces pyxidatus]|uniref:Uncharacterized protein n=1 Tax=Artomyces pyxidatus TaxID=48021 RepID=A0ACB8SVM5_9AGAM|nr:hypothetical protein BV25DRAFT_1918057 [Artomyces pyxidatus]
MTPSVNDGQTKSISQRTFDWLNRNLNFYRLHILFFTFTPLIFSGIMYASNSSVEPIAYIDALFLCVTSMTVCGLATVDLSGLTAWQQAIMFIQMCLGSPVFISWVVVYVRRRMFTVRCENIVRAAARNVAAASPGKEVEVPTTWTTRIASFFTPGSHLSTIRENPDESALPTPTKTISGRERKHGTNDSRKLRPDMIRRMDDAPQLVNPSGWISEGRTDPLNVVAIETNNEKARSPSREHIRQLSLVDENTSSTPEPSESEQSSSEQSRDDRAPRRERRLSDPGERSRPLSAAPDRRQRFQMGNFENGDDGSPVSVNRFPRTQTVEFAPTPHRDRRSSVDRTRLDYPTISELNFRRPTIDTTYSEHPTGSIRPPAVLDRVNTQVSYAMGKQHGDFGGFPGPGTIVSRLFKKFAPNRVRHHLSRTITMPRTQTITSQRGNTQTAGSKAVPYISFDAVVGRNSVFHSLEMDQLEELGGVEYRALTALLWLVAGYHILVQLLAFTIIGPYMTIGKWKDVFSTQMQHRNISPAWFSLFQVVSAYTNTGTSLVDQSMVPFQTAYPMILVMIFLILAGNTAFPVFLRLSIWITSKFFPKTSRIRETLHFLLDHPRRCFIYLFPSHQTWFLFFVLVILNTTDWFCFLVLDLGNPVIGAIPPGTRVIDGWLQAVAVRAAGFATFSLSALAPGVKVLYVIMMYISVYPIAMSVRSTNVYEEQSLGIYQDEESLDEENMTFSGSRMTVWSHYLAMHARKQLSFDMWWLGLALFFVCIFERNEINDVDNLSWLTIFNIVFELVSAYGTVGLSLGVPYANYSLCGAFSPLSKLIVCAVMLRGRHRGLPVAIDRAVLLPFEYRQTEDDGFDKQEMPSSPRPRRTSMRSVPTMMSTARQPSLRSPIEKPDPAAYRCRPLQRTLTGQDEVVELP